LLSLAPAFVPSATAGAIAGAIACTDFTRRSPFALGGPRDHKEWHHFVILSGEIDLLVNFSCCDDARRDAPQGAEFPRLVLLVRHHTWDGDVEQFSSEQARVRGGQIDFAFAHNRLRFHDGAFEISAALEHRPVAVEMRLTPVAMPAYAPAIPMIDGPPLNWVVAPRLRVSGSVTLRGRRFDLDGAPAYHDHNWGRFLWGHDVSWEWGFVLPECDDVPWCMTFVRLTNRARTRALAQQLLLWRNEHLVALFREPDLEPRTDLGHLRPSGVLKVPRVMALLAPETRVDVPRWFEMHARRTNGDWLECRCEARDVAQVVIPSETRLGVTIFNEVLARTTVRGSLAGEPLDFRGRSVLEFIRDY